MAVMLIGWVVFDFLVTRTAPPGWASTVIVVLTMSSVQLISLGIIGEYPAASVHRGEGTTPLYRRRCESHRSRSGGDWDGARGRAARTILDTAMIEEWSAGVADASIDEAGLTELRSLIRPHPWWQARAQLTVELLRRNRVVPACTYSRRRLRMGRDD